MAFRVALVSPRHVPEVEGGAENLWRGLTAALQDCPGVQADWVRIPSPERSLKEVLQSYRTFAASDFAQYDQVIATKYPGWAVTHPNLVVYLQHTLRGLYDTYPDALPRGIAHLGLPSTAQWPTEPLTLADFLLDLLDRHGASVPALYDFPGPFARACVQALDRASFAPGRVQRFMAISQTVAQRQDYFPPAVLPMVVHHPSNLPQPPDAAVLRDAGPRDILLAPSRLEAAKRFALIFEAYALAQQACSSESLPPLPPLWVVGSGPDEPHLKSIAPAGVVFQGRLSEEALAKAYARAQLVLFAPQDEDYGLITLEAARAATPVLTTRDSGGPTELVEHGKSGLVCEPHAAAMARALREALRDPDGLEHMGAALRARCAGIQWPALAQALLQSTWPPRSMVLVLNTFPSVPTTSGGRQRMQGLYGALAQHHPVHLVSLCHPDSAHEWVRHGPHFEEELVPAGPGFAAVEKTVTWRVGASAGDLAVGEGLAHLSLFRSQILQALPRARWVVLSHPYAYPVLESIFESHPNLMRPIVYEAHNVEADLKAQLYRPESGGQVQVAALEARLTRAARLVCACSQADLRRLSERSHRPLTEPGLVLPNGLSEQAFCMPSAWLDPHAKNPIPPYLGLFMGSAHGPNIEAVMTMVEALRCHPGLQQAVREQQLRLVVMGSVCQALKGTDALPEGIHLLGTVSEAEKQIWLSRCHFGLNPMASGSGTNLKMGEYAAAGLVMISTEVGARGGVWLAQTHYLECSQAGLAPALLEALEMAKASPELLRDMAHRARDRAREVLGWNAVGLDLALALNHSSWPEPFVRRITTVA